MIVGPTQRTGFPHRPLVRDCLACNRIAWTPMCQLCADLEDAEERADERRDDERHAD